MSEAEELVQFLEADTRPDVRRVALDSLLRMSAAHSVVPVLLHHQAAVLHALTRLLRSIPWSAEAKAVCLTLVNSTSFPEVREAFVQESERLSIVVGLVSSEAESGVWALKILSNLSTTEAGRVFEALDGPKFLRDSVQRLTALPPDASETDHAYSLYAGYVVRNLSQLKPVRDVLCEDGMFSRFLPMTAFPGPSKRKHIALDVLRNLCFDTGIHEVLLEGEDVLVALLLPIMGGEELGEKENEALPIDLQYLPTSKQREPDAQLRLIVLESIYQLCSSSFGREKCRSSGVYYAIREYERWESEPDYKSLCRDLIGVLIRTEEEMGAGDLKAIPDHLTLPAQTSGPTVFHQDDISSTGLVRM